MLTTQKDKISYGIGMNIGRSITNGQIEINLDALTAGLKAVVTGTQPLLNDEQYREAMGALQTQMQAKQAERMKAAEAKNKELAEKTKKENEAWLTANKKKEGVVSTPSGLQYKVVVKGTGAKPTTNDTVILHYRGSLIEGAEFESSYKKGEPAEFPVAKLSKGWREALLQMPVGSQWQLFIPAELAYGEVGPRPRMAPNNTLLFDVELIGIKEAKPAETKAAEKAK